MAQIPEAEPLPNTTMILEAPFWSVLEIAVGGYLVDVEADQKK